MLNHAYGNKNINYGIIDKKMGGQMRTTNPLQRESVYNSVYDSEQGVMTISGTAGKLLLLSAIMLIGAYFTFYQFRLGHTDYVNGLMIGGIAIGFILAIIMSFKPKTTPYLSPVYALTQGAYVAGISCIFEQMFKGIVIQAVSLTLLTVLVMAFLFVTGIIKATEKMRSILFAATITIGLFYLISFVLMFFNISVPYFTQNTPLNIGINVVIAGIAALYLILDFDFIQKGVERGAPAFFEWYGAFSLLVTVVWLYIELLRLLSRLKDR